MAELPISTTHVPESADDLCAVVRSCYASATPVYPIGGGTSLSYGLMPKQQGVGLSLAKLNRVIDYPARDMTITVEPGITMAELARVLTAERQQLPIDVPQAEQATIGGGIATNWNGPRRYGLGSVRDYVIGVSAVDGRGMAFKGGGRVVKNVAGYDFCKLLTGSLGMLGVISQVTLKVRPLAEKSLLMVAQCNDLAHAEKILAGLQTSAATPTSVTLLSGPDWTSTLSLLFPQSAISNQQAAIVVGLEGNESEVNWMRSQIHDDWSFGFAQHAVIADHQELWKRIVEWPASGDAPLVLKASIRPSGVTSLIAAAREVNPKCSVLSHAGNGVVFLKFSEFPKEGLSRTLIGQLQPAAGRLGGNVVVISNPGGTDMTTQSSWGNVEGLDLMRAVKRNFDPKGILNAGRFVV